MKKTQKIVHRLRQWVAIIAILALLSTIFISFAIPKSQALDLNLNGGGLEDALCEGLGEGGVISCGNDSATSFTNFEGSFVPPDEEGYAEGITQTDSAREFIVNVTNFVLSFLGLAAVIVIIYGGFMYVTAAGEQERVDKGKKSVMYAVIGIIIVLISFALVNTIIKGAGGGSDSTVTGLYNSGATGESLSEFQTDQMAQHVQRLTQDFVSEYTSYTNVITIVDAMFNIRQLNNSALKEFKEGFDLVLKEADPFSQTADAARAGLKLVEPKITSNLKQRVLELAGHSDWMQTGVLTADQVKKESSVQLAMDLNQGELSGYCETICAPTALLGPAILACVADCTANPDSNAFKYKLANLIDPYDLRGDVIHSMEAVALAAHGDFTGKMEEIKGDFEDLQESFQDQTAIATIVSGIVEQVSGYTAEDTVEEGNFNDVSGTKSFVPFVPGPPNYNYFGAPSGGSSKVGRTVEQMNELYLRVKALKFTSAIISANTKQGNAPLTVTFNGLDSSDPTDLSLTPEQYTWDLLGDGFGTVSAQDAGTPGFSALSADNKNGPNVTYTYTEPGTYRVGLRVTSSDSANIAAGISYLSIKVNPPSSIIDLNVTGGLSNVEQDVSDSRTVSFTGEDAKAGITFDAGGTTDGDGNTDTIVEYNFDFGDGESARSESPEATHYYTEEGTYRFELEVTDQNGIKDRKRLTVIVASPAAHLEANKDHVDIGEIVIFDASASLTDFGAINNYAWNITRGTETVLSEPSGEEELQYAFDQPGTYTITVEVTDSSGQSNATSLTVTVSSSEPVAAFDYTINNPARPNVVQLDASSSYDPDTGDTLTYEWEIGGQGYESLFGFMEGTSATSQKPIIEFYEPGNHNVSLTVKDQYTGELQQSSSVSKDIELISILSIGVKNNGASAIFLDEQGQATVELELSTNAGEAFEIDWNDGGDIETFADGNTSSVGGENRFHVWGNASHSFTEAGTFHANITVLDEAGNTNALTRNIYVGNGTEPIPVLNVSVDNLEAIDPNNVVANRTNTIKFDAGGSLDLDGKAIKQTGAYSWVLGDGTRATGKTLTKKYDEIGDFEVTLTVRSTADSSVSSSVTIQVSIVDTPPRILGLIVQPQNDALITPLVVKVEANAKDDDGKITRYKFWYYDQNNSSEPLGEQISLTSQTFLTINTNGTSGDINEYAFAVEITDDENNTVSSLDELLENQVPVLEVENGINNPPEADFTVDRTNVMVGETVTFTSTSSDEDGEIVEYIWDVEGDGFFNNPSTTDLTLLHEYNSTNPDGVEVRLKVVDDMGATDVSDPIRVYVDSLTQDPTAAFRYSVATLAVTFVNNASADIANNATLVSYEWDFDTSDDTDGDGDASNDVDSTEQNPKFTYESFGRHSVTLKVTDNEGNSDSVTNVVDLVELDPPKAGFKATIVDGLNVKFTNASTPGSAQAPIENYKWDFDGDGITDSEEESPRYAYEEYGTYNVILTVEDSLGRSDDFKSSLKIEKPKAKDLEAFLTTQPAGDPARGGDVYLQGTEGNVTFSFRSANGEGTVKYCIDKNVFFDTDGNGKKDDDCDHLTSEAGSWTTNFSKDWGSIVIKLTVKDDGAQVYTVTKQIFFEATPVAPGTTSVLPVSTIEALYILLTALGFALLGTKLYTRKESETECEKNT